MTIKEIENLSGMTRANIRFYETEGLLRPARNSNGYRNYSEEDLNTLQKIRLLRTLHLSLEDIRSVSLGQNTLTEVPSSQEERGGSRTLPEHLQPDLHRRHRLPHPGCRALSVAHGLSLRCAGT